MSCSPALQRRVRYVVAQVGELGRRVRPTKQGTRLWTKAMMAAQVAQAHLKTGSCALARGAALEAVRTMRKAVKS